MKRVSIAVENNSMLMKRELFTKKRTSSRMQCRNPKELLLKVTKESEKTTNHEDPSSLFTAVVLLQ